MKLYDLKINRMLNPIGLSADSLQFSFKAADGDKFRVKIYSEDKVTEVYQKIIKLKQISCFYLPYCFELGKVYFWMVECESYQSEFASFEIALPLDSEFITPVKDIICPTFIKEFRLDEISKARLYITGLGLYRAFLNGKRIGDSYLTPFCNDYDAYLRYQTYDITDLLKENNKLEVVLGDGWYKGRFGIIGHGGNTYGDKYLLKAKLVVEQMDGSIIEMKSDDSWLATDSVILDTSIYDGETRDDTKKLMEPTACITYNAKFMTVPDFSSPVKNKMERKPSLYVSPKGEQILDFGQNMVGFCKFMCHEEKGSEIQLQYGELLQQECFYNDNLRTAKAEFNYISDGIDKEVEPFFTFYGFRYVKVSGMKNVNPEDFTGTVLYSDLTQTLQVATDNDKINRLMQNSLWGQKGNFVDVPTDCPQRDERLGWTGDTQVFVNTACYHMDCFNFYKKYMKDLRYDQSTYYEGDIPMYSPSIKKMAGKGGAVWADAGTIVPWNVYQAYGDAQLLSENYSMMKDYVDTVIAADIKEGNHHIITSGFTFGDWLAQDGVCAQASLGGTDSNFIKTVYYRNSLELVSKAAKVLKKKEDVKYYASLANKVKKAILNEYFSDNGRLAVDTQTAYVISLHYNIYKDKNKLIEGFKIRLNKDFYRMKSGFTGTPLMLPVLFENGMVNDAYRILFNEKCPGWLYAVNLGATTIWERWNSILPDGTISGTNMNSLNHYAYGAVCEAIYAHIGGLKCASPGWNSALIAPKPNHRLKHMKIVFDSPRGIYQVEWKILDDGNFKLDVVIPFGTTATIQLPDHEGNLSTIVSAGEYKYCYMPVIDYLHPFNQYSIMLDILCNEEAANIFKEKLPKVYDQVTGENEEYLSMNFVALGYLPIFATNSNEVATVGEMFNKVKV
ncbi:alpha-L-rhamnosidase [[Clostridium] fimetarium]|uniref:alpha-L-rhamnosidase n=1 Tax=[Clostridium] fimetarium TaxID=99656 RepID=A0A1I0NDC3_9FIRM|nr:alpha-L-rhamnosidase [[Clostridium] fimetarium]SEV99193.1 alpha-L-rhamnosidase [[Clostridium] fimetarium]